MKYPDKCVLVVCHGLFLALAERLARDFGTVLVWLPGRDAQFPVPNAGRLGEGLPNVERVDSVFGPHFDEVDLFAFPDLYSADLQLYLESIGKRVWGARMGEELEIYRGLCKEHMATLGLASAPWKTVKGMDALREHLKAHENQHVKIDRWRGLFETFRSPSYDLIETKLDEIAHTLGGFQHDTEFICEDDLPDCVEVGVDGYCIDGKFPDSTLCGIEVKDLGYVSRFMAWKDIPEPIRRWSERMGPTLKNYGYRGFLSNEIRIGADHEPYMIDACCRAASPPNELYQEFYENLPEIIWEGAVGVLVDPKPAGKFGVEIIMRSSFAESNWQPVEIDPEFRRFVKLFNPVRTADGREFVVPQDEQMKEIGAIIGYGETLDEALAMVKDVGDSVKGYGITIPEAVMDKAQQEIEGLAEIGLNVFEIAKEPNEK